MHRAKNAHFLLFRRMAKTCVTIDLDRDIIIIPDNFFKKIAEENEKLERYGAKPVKALDRIKRSYEAAMADTDNRLLTQTNAKTTTRTKKVAAATDKKDENPTAAAPATTDAPTDKK